MTHDQVRARVEAFVADFHQRWQRAGRMPNGFPSPSAFAAWEEELRPLARTHGTPEFRTGAEGSLGSNPAHDPSAETITGMQVDVDRAVIRTAIENGGSPTFYEYRLVRVEDEWRIGQLLTFLDPPGAPLVDAVEAERLLGSAHADASLAAISSRLQLDLPSLFAEGRRVTPFDQPVPLEVHHLGTLTCTSGVLTVRDFGYGDFALEPLARQVPPGTYPVEVSRAEHTNIALRVRLSDAPTVAWYRAERANGSNVVGVDAANVAVLDLASLVRCEAQHAEQLFDQESERLSEEPGTVFSLTGDVTDAVMVTSGYGDGAYPCYWGVAEDGTLTALVVDFLVRAEDIVRVVTTPWQLGLVEAPELDAYGLGVEPRAEDLVVSHDSGDIRGIRVLGPDGPVIMDSDRLGVTVSGGRRSYMWRTASPPTPGSVLEVTLSEGYRHT